MGILTFKGGVHPYDGKELSKDKPIQPLNPKGDLVYPLSQHIGAPAKAVVQKGDHVLMGQMIAEAGGFVSAPIYASVSGTVKGIEPHLTTVGSVVDAIVIENDEKYETVEFQGISSLDELSKEEILKRISLGGVVGMGGAGFPTHVKLAPKDPDKIDYILVNGAECEPYLTSDYRRMLEEPEKVVQGLKVILKLFDHAKGCICIEDDIYVFQGVRIMGLGGSMEYIPGSPNQYTELAMWFRIIRMWWKLLRRRGFDILVTHAPAYEVNDMQDLPHRGFKCFRTLMEKFHPKLFLHGHVHATYGAGKFKRKDRFCETTVINAYDFYVVEYPPEHQG